MGWLAEDSIDERCVRRAIGTLRQRGPDGETVWLDSDGRVALAHARLAILDLGERAAEPFHSPRSSFIHNGEIYNFRDLRRDFERSGETFRTTTDGEVAQRVLDSDGASGISRLDGMFAIGYWDRVREQLLLARDRLGIKPLYYFHRGTSLAFASQPRALLALPGITPEVDEDGLADLLAYGFVPRDRSIFRGIRKLPAGHALSFDRRSGTVRVWRYWRAEPTAHSRDVAELRDLLDKAIVSNLVADVPLGSFLSGGIDSTIVTNRAVANSDGPLPTFTVAYAGGGLADLTYAEIVSRSFGTAHHAATLDPPDLGAALGQIAEAFDEPVFDSTALALLELSRLARRHVKVVLTGDGGDEVFGGYGWYQSALAYEAAHSRLQRAIGARALTAASGALRAIRRSTWAARLSGSEKLVAPSLAERYFGLRGFFSSAEQETIRGSAGTDAPWLFRHLDREELPLPQRWMSIDLESYLPDNNLVLVDRASMAVGLEARVPLLDHRLVEYALDLAGGDLVTETETKVFLRRATAGWMPKLVLDRRKYGFSPPFKAWLRGPSEERAFRMLRNGNLAREGVIRPDSFGALYRRRTPRRHGKLWLLLNLEAWYTRWICGSETLNGLRGGRAC